MNDAREDGEPDGHQGTRDCQDEAGHESHKRTSDGQGEAMDDKDYDDDGQGKGDLNNGRGGDKIPQRMVRLERMPCQPF